MNRREFSGALALGGAAAIGNTTKVRSDKAQPRQAFSREMLIAKAKRLSEQPFAPPKTVPKSFTDLGYDQYRDIRFRRDARLWLGADLGFALDFLHAGFLFRKPVEVFVVEEGTATRVAYAPSLFDFGPAIPPLPEDVSNMFSGIRLWAPINARGRFDEFAVFQGASYFRAVGKDQGYGLSARGLAIDTAEAKGEEFPFFRAFWIERPPTSSKTVTVHALLDSQSISGAYRFEITPGTETRMDVATELFARSDIEVLGIAPLTSMFLFNPVNRYRFDDFRNAVHDSDGLLMRRGNGEWLWRPLTNPTSLQISLFADENPHGFGLMQRASRFHQFEDLESRYGQRPSLWVEPRGDWGRGSVELVEIPTTREYNDNIVAFWRPAEPIRAGESKSFAYWLSWGPSTGDVRLAQVVATRTGLTLNNKRRLFVIDFQRPQSGDAIFDEHVRPEASASRGKVENVVGRANELTGGYRVSFEFDPAGGSSSELRLVLARTRKPISETWLFRWTKA